LYYRHAILQFPDTQMAEFSRYRLQELGYEVVSEPEEHGEQAEQAHVDQDRDV
jgi:hypothetical protein